MTYRPHDDTTLPTEVDGWEQHRILVEAFKRRSRKWSNRRVAKKPQRPKRKRPKKRRVPQHVKAQRARLRNVRTRTLFKEIARRAKEKQMAEMTPEKRKEMREKKAATWKQKQAACRHENIRPLAGKRTWFYCKSCRMRLHRPNYGYDQIEPEELKKRAEEEMEIVT